MFGWLGRLFGSITRALATAAPVAATVAKAAAAERINKSKKISVDLKPIVTQIANDAIDDALAEVVKEATGQ